MEVDHPEHADRLGREHQPGTAEVVDLDPSPRGRGSIAGLAIVDHPGQAPAKAEFGPSQVEQPQRHARQLDLERGLLAAQHAFEQRIAAREADLGLRQPPTAILLGGQHGAARHGDRLAAILPARNGGDAVGRDIGVEVEREAVRPLARDPAGHLAAAVYDVRLRGEVGEVEPAIFEPVAADVGIDAGIALGIATGRHDAGAVDADRHPAGKSGLARGDIDSEAHRPLALRPEGECPVEPAARQREIARNPCLAQHQAAGDIGAVDIKPLDRDPRRTVLGQDKAEHAVERPEQRSARNIEREALGGRGERDADVLQPRSGIGIGQHQHAARAIGGEFGIDGEGSVVGLPTTAGQRGARAAAARHHLAVEPGVQPRAGDRHVAQDHRLARAHAESALEADLLAGEIDDGVVADLRQHAGEIGAQAPRHGWAEFGEDLGIGGHLARAVDLEPARGDRASQRIGPAGNVAAQRQRRVQPGEDDPRRIGRKLLAFEIIGQQARHPALDEARIGLRVAGGDPLGRQRHWHLHHLAVEPREALLHQPLRLDPLRHQPSDCQPVVDGEIAEGAGKVGGKARLLEAPAFAQQIGNAQGGAGARAFDAVVGEVDYPCPAQIERAGDHGGAALEDAVLKREAGRDRDLRPRSTGQQVLARKAGTHPPEHADLARVIGDLKGGDRRPGDGFPVRHRQAPNKRRPAPLAPCPVARDARVVAVGKARKARQHAACGGEVIGFEIEAVAVRLGIDQHRDPVLRAQPRARVHQRAALADIDLGERIDPLGLTGGNALGDDEILDRQLVDADVEIRQQRRVGIAGQQFGQARQPPAPRGHLADVEPAPQPVQRPPVELDFGDGEEQALGVAHPHIAQCRRAVDIALDPPDGKAQARGGRDRRDLVGDEALADRGRKEPRHQHQRCQQQRQHPAEPLGPHPLAACWAAVVGQFRGGGLGRIHQNACPRLT